MSAYTQEIVKQLRRLADRVERGDVEAHLVGVRPPIDVSTTGPLREYMEGPEETWTLTIRNP